MHGWRALALVRVAQLPSARCQAVTNVTSANEVHELIARLRCWRSRGRS
jgi:hypothetical protein